MNISCSAERFPNCGVLVFPPPAPKECFYIMELYFWEGEEGVEAAGLRRDGNKEWFREQLGSDVLTENLTSSPLLPPEGSVKRVGSQGAGARFQSE